jgi:hypothetical protein
MAGDLLPEAMDGSGGKDERGRRAGRSEGRRLGGKPEAGEDSAHDLGLGEDRDDAAFCTKRDSAGRRARSREPRNSRQGA